MNDSTFVRLNDSNFIRKDVLKSALDSTRLLKYYSRYKTLRNEKSKRVRELKSIMDNIGEMSEVLSNKLPHIKSAETGVERIKVSKKKGESKKNSVHTNKIDKELREIEEKLNNLKF